MRCQQGGKYDIIRSPKAKKNGCLADEKCGGLRLIIEDMLREKHQKAKKDDPDVQKDEKVRDPAAGLGSAGGLPARPGGRRHRAGDHPGTGGDPGPGDEAADGGGEIYQLRADQHAGRAE